MPYSARAGTAFTPRLSRSRRMRRDGTRESGGAVADLLADLVAVAVAVTAGEERRPLAEPAEVPCLVALAVIRAGGRHHLWGVAGHEHVTAAARRRALHLDVRLFHGLPLSVFIGAGSGPSGERSRSRQVTCQKRVTVFQSLAVRPRELAAITSVRATNGPPSLRRHDWTRGRHPGELGKEEPGPAVDVVLPDLAAHARHAGAAVLRAQRDGLVDGLRRVLYVVGVDEEGVAQLLG